MSINITEKITCPNCGRESDFQVWQSINTLLHPEMKMQVRNGEAFLFKCPDCGYEAPADYTFLYHQMEDKLMIYCVTSEKEIEETKKAFLGDLFHGYVADRDELGLRKQSYRYRIVSSKNQLLEKLRIFDAELDDRVIEIVKFFYLARLKKQKPGLVFDEALWDKNNNRKWRFVLFGKGECIGGIEIDSNLYYKMEEYFRGKLKANEKNDILINRDWVAALLDEEEMDDWKDWDGNGKVTDDERAITFFTVDDMNKRAGKNGGGCLSCVLLILIVTAGGIGLIGSAATAVIPMLQQLF